MKKAVIYARYSCDKQTEQSIEGQLRICTEFAKSNDITIVDTYIDRAISGKTDKRPNFIQLIEDSNKKQFDYVIVYKLDRFSRNRYDSAVYKRLLKKNNVKVLSACEQISDNPEGIILESLIEGMAEYYSAELSQKTKRGMRETILKGNFTGGKVLFGYKVVNKKVQIEDKNAQAIRIAFEEYANGSTLKEIAEKLNASGFSYNGKLFTASCFHDKFSNIRYIGQNEYEGEIYTNTYPAIIDKETFKKVQLMLERNKKNSGANRAKEDYILSGKLFCGLCGSTMVGTSGVSKTGKYLYYTCSKRYKKHDCKKEYENKQDLEDFIFEKTMQYILKPHLVDRIIDNAYEYFKNDRQNEQVVNIEKELKEIETKIDSLYSIFSKTNSKEILKRANRDIELLEDDKERLKKDLKIAKLSKKVIHTKEELRTIFDMFLDGSKDDTAFKKRIIKLFVNSIFVFEDKIIIYYNLFDNHIITHSEMLEDLDNNFEECEGVQQLEKLPYCQDWGANFSNMSTMFCCRVGLGLIVRRLS